ncbi:MAG: GtrA family protein [Actinomycetes bacterium]
MNFSPSALLAHAKSDEGRKQLRYVGVSVVFVPVGQILIQVLGATVFDSDFTKASIASAMILILPNFFANKYLVWRETSSDNLRTQIIVFWVAGILGVGFATFLTWVVEQPFHGEELTGSDRIKEKLAVFSAQIVGFGVVWVLRYLVLDRWIFKVTHHGEEPSPDDLDMMHGDVPI